jgi:hypothetical protein
MKKTSLKYSSEELFDKVNWELVNGKIQECSLLSWEFEEVSALVIAAFNKFAPKDFDSFERVSVERRFVYEVPERGSNPFIQYDVDEKEIVGLDLGRCIKGYIDIHAYERGDGFSDDKGKISGVIIDWKTTSNLDATWTHRQLDSWQGKLYARVTGARRVEFRGVQRDGRTRAVGYEWPTEAYDDGDVDNYVLQAVSLREQLWKSEVWPKHKPYACEAYGRKCDYHKFCRDGIGDQHHKLIQPKPFSYSGTETFFLCHERYRLDTLFSEEDFTNERANFGKAFHAGIAEAYLQLFGGK